MTGRSSDAPCPGHLRGSASYPAGRRLSRGGAGARLLSRFVVFQGFAMRKISPAARPAADDPSPRAGGGIKAGLQANGKLFQIRRVFVQAFPNKALAVLRYFKGLQGLQTQRVRFQIFRRVRLLSVAFPTPWRPLPLPRASGGGAERRVECFGSQRGSRSWLRSNSGRDDFETLARIQIIRKKCPLPRRAPSGRQRRVECVRVVAGFASMAEEQFG
jgi:hypothetical protein